ncbi:endonuclease domain-containing protein [uncultured Desulfobulbus sp.]|uniref:endonuclease domain-containing protein n=1 Tax=uncultured Desulfobulbus sp. TaxID=239745 RepID=UPI0029C7E6F2|nr:endonuclease domain-containing protein [uncultured Desulfobulbus sp.]
MVQVFIPISNQNQNLPFIRGGRWGKKTSALGKSMTSYYNRSDGKSLRRTLRSKINDFEKIIWSKINRNQLGVKFRRQYGVGPYVIDFYCPLIKLAIEIDGDSHGEDDNPKKDIRRQNYIENFAIHFLRYKNEEVRDNLEGVLLDILRDISKHIETGGS